MLAKLGYQGLGIVGSVNDHQDDLRPAVPGHDGELLVLPHAFNCIQRPWRPPSPYSP